MTGKSSFEKMHLCIGLWIWYFKSVFFLLSGWLLQTILVHSLWQNFSCHFWKTALFLHGSWTLHLSHIVQVNNSNILCKISLSDLTCFFCSVAFLHKFDKNSVTGVCFPTSNQYPCAQIYEYSKCKPIPLTVTYKSTYIVSFFIYIAILSFWLYVLE